MKKGIAYVYLFILLPIEVQAQLNPIPSDSVELALYYFNKSEEVYEYGNLDSTIYYTFRAQEIYEQLGDWSNNLLCLNAIATCYGFEHNYDRAFEFQDSVYDLAKQHLKRGDRVWQYILNNMSSNSRLKGDYTKAIRFSKELFDVLDDGNTEMQCIAFMQTGYLYSLVGDFVNAIDLSKQGIHIRENTLDPFDFRLAESYIPMGFILKDKGEYEKALEYYLKAQKILEKNKRHSRYNSYYISNKLNLAGIYYLLNEFDLAQEQLDILNNRNLKLAKQHQADLISMQCKIDIETNPFVNLHEVAERQRRSNVLYTESLSNLKADLQITDNLTIIGKAFKDQKDYGNAEKFYLNALDSLGGEYLFLDAKQITNKVEAIDIVVELIDIYKSTGQTESIRKYYNALLGVINALNFESKTASIKAYWAQRNLQIYEDAITYFLSVKDTSYAFTFMEQNKSNLLLDELAGQMNVGYSNVPVEILNREKELNQRLYFLNRQINNLDHEELESKHLLQKLHTDRLATQLDLSNLINQLEAKYESYYKIKYDVSEVTVPDIQKELDNETVFLEYFIGNENAYCVKITNEDLRIEVIEDHKSLQEDVVEYMLMLRNKKSSVDEIARITKKLSKLLLPQFSEIKGFNKLIIVPDDYLNNFPFQNLFDINDLESPSVSYQYSAKLMLLLGERALQSSNVDLLTFAYNNNSNQYLAERSCIELDKYNLICSKSEVAQLSEVLTNRTVQKIRDVRKKQISELFVPSKILHLATHACFDSVNVDESLIYFNNFSLSSGEIQKTEIKSEMVVLSACESGFGKIVKGEGSMSLAKSFFHAGAKSTVVSLWPVDDCATSELMEYFYINLNNGMGKDESLKMAKNDYVNNAHHLRKHPYYWSGFVLIGDIDPLWLGAAEGGYGLVFILLILILFSLFVLKKKRNQ